MPTTKISQLPEKNTIGDNDRIIINDHSSNPVATKRVSADKLKTLTASSNFYVVTSQAEVNALVPKDADVVFIDSNGVNLNNTHGGVSQFVNGSFYKFFTTGITGFHRQNERDLFDYNDLQNKPTIPAAVTPRAAGTGLTLSGNNLNVTNPFTDADETKLDGIESSADVTDKDNVYPVSKEILTAGDNVTITSNDGNKTLTIASTGGGGGGGNVNPRAAGDGLTLNGNTLSVTNPFTDTDETKLDSVESGAEVNPLHEVKFSGASADIGAEFDPSDFGIYNGATQRQSGNINEADTLYIANKNATFGQDPSQPSTILDAVDVVRFFKDKVDNGGDVILAIINQNDTSNIIYVQSDTITEVVRSGSKEGFKLTNLTWFGGHVIEGNNDRWSIVAGNGGHFVNDIVDNSILVHKTDLEGKESDRYASYTNGFMASSYRVGSICLFNQTSVPIDDTNAVRQPDIADRNTDGVIAFGQTLRSDKDPNHFQTAATEVVGNYTSGTKLYISVWNKPADRMVVTLTGDAAVSGTGNAAFIWAKATWDEVNDIPDVAVVGDYFKIERDVPSNIDLRIPASDILDGDGVWVRTNGSNVNDNFRSIVQGYNEAVLVDNTFKINDTAVDRYIQINEGSSQINIRVLQSDTDDVDKLNRLGIAGATVEIGDWEVAVQNNFSASNVGAGRNYSFNYSVVGGTKPSDDDIVNLKLLGEDIHRIEVVAPVFKLETTNVAGKGGTSGQVWTRGSGDTNAAWQTPTGEANVNADWDATSGDAEILNKPTIPTTPTFVVKSGVTSSLTNISDTVYNDNDMLEVSYHETAYSGDFRRIRTGIFRMGDLSTSQDSWLALNPTNGGRVNLRKTSENKIQASWVASNNSNIIRVRVVGQSAS